MRRTGAWLLLLLAAPGLQGLDLRSSAGALVEMVLTREGRSVGPGRQVFRIVPATSSDATWPAELARRETRRRRRKGRRSRDWSGFLGDRPAWGVDGQVLAGPRQARRIRTRYEVWALAPGPFLLHARADDPGGQGRRRLQKRAAFLLRQLTRMNKGFTRDPFRAVRLSPEYRRWREHYRFRLPDGLEFQLTGPVPEPLPELPLRPSGRKLFGAYPFMETEPGAPERFLRGVVPGFLVRCSPTFFSRRQQKIVYELLGTSSGVEITRAGDPDAWDSVPEEPDVEEDLPDLEADLDLLEGDDL